MNFLDDETKLDNDISINMSHPESKRKDSGFISRAQSGTTRASTARSRSPGDPADYEEIMDILTTEAEQYINDLTDDSESVGFGMAEGRKSGFSRPGSSWTRSDSRPTSSWSRPGSRPGSSWSRPGSRPGSLLSRPGSTWDRSSSGMDDAILKEFSDELRILMENGAPRRPFTVGQPSARPNTPSGEEPNKLCSHRL